MKHTKKRRFESHSLVVVALLLAGCGRTILEPGAQSGGSPSALDARSGAPDSALQDVVPVGPDIAALADAPPEPDGPMGPTPDNADAPRPNDPPQAADRLDSRLPSDPTPLDGTFGPGPDARDARLASDPAPSDRPADRPLDAFDARLAADPPPDTRRDAADLRLPSEAPPIIRQDAGDARFSTDPMPRERPPRIDTGRSLDSMPIDLQPDTRDARLPAERMPRERFFDGPPDTADATSG